MFFSSSILDSQVLDLGRDGVMGRWGDEEDEGDEGDKLNFTSCLLPPASCLLPGTTLIL
jgi:hypothetical protein